MIKKWFVFSFILCLCFSVSSQEKTSERLAETLKNREAPEWFNNAKQWHSAELINWYYNLVGKDAIVNNRWGSGIDVGFLTPEYSAGIKVTNRLWAEVRGIGRSFGLNRNEDLVAYGTSKELITQFVQTVANGGGMILNVGPKFDGQIPLIQQERLMQLGNWLKINGAAIYGSKPFEITEEEKRIYKERVDNNIDFNWVRNAPIKGIAYPINIKYNENKQNAQISLFWTSNKIAKEIVLASSFFLDKEKTKLGILGAYSSMETYLYYTRNNNNVYAISFEWPEDEFVLKIPNSGRK